MTTGLLGLSELPLSTIRTLLDSAKQMKAHATAHSTPLTLKGRTILTLFFEPSTRTRVSFETAIKRLGGSTVGMAMESSSTKKGETLFDTIKNLEAMGFDGVVVRHRHAGVPHFLQSHLSFPVINAGDGLNEHPSQGLLDCFTLEEHLGSLEGKTILLLGDIMHSRVARSNLWALKKLGARIIVSGPPTLIPPGLSEWGIMIAPRLDDVLPLVDAVNVLRVQYERQEHGYFPSVREYRALFGLTEKRCQRLPSHCCILHPGPINRGIELDSVVADGPHSVILDQVTNGVAIRMAMMDYLINQGGAHGDTNGPD